MQVMVLEGGVKGWVKAGPQFTQYMDGFDEAYWQKVFAESAPAPQQAVPETIVEPVEDESQRSSSKRPLSGFQDTPESKRMLW